jgi:hypothetical protein
MAIEKITAERGLQMLRSVINEVFRKKSGASKKANRLRLEGEKGIQELGHREYVGGMWEEVGRLQFQFLIQQGLKPNHCLLDIACGSLRGGVHFIRYLEPGNYLGIDKERKLIELGIKKELGWRTYSDKKPEFLVSANFEFQKFSKRPHFAIAQSLFTHLNAADICLCLRNLKQFVGPGHTFFTTFFKGDSAQNQDSSHSQVNFLYSPDEMASFGQEVGWKVTYFGDWNHPRSQMMMKYES